MSKNNKNGIQVKPKSFATNSKKNFDNRITNVATVAIYLPLFSKFPKKKLITSHFDRRPH